MSGRFPAVGFIGLIAIGLLLLTSFQNHDAQGKSGNGGLHRQSSTQPAPTATPKDAPVPQCEHVEGTSA